MSDKVSKNITRWQHFQMDRAQPMLPVGTRAATASVQCQPTGPIYVLASDHDTEIERLRIEVDKYDSTIAQRDLEIERLRAALEQIAHFRNQRTSRRDWVDPDVQMRAIALAALSGDSSFPEASPSGWQPIETAPKSPSDAGRDRHYVLVVYPGWKDGKPNPFVLMAYQDSLGWDTGTWRLHERPTHWMPLPALPSSQKTDEHSVKGLASAGSSAAVNPRDTVGGSAEPSGRPAENTSDNP